MKRALLVLGGAVAGGAVAGVVGYRVGHANGVWDGTLAALRSWRRAVDVWR